MKTVNAVLCFVVVGLLACSDKPGKTSENDKKQPAQTAADGSGLVNKPGTLWYFAGTPRLDHNSIIFYETGRWVDPLYVGDTMQGRKGTWRAEGDKLTWIFKGGAMGNDGTTFTETYEIKKTADGKTVLSLDDEICPEENIKYDIECGPTVYVLCEPNVRNSCINYDNRDANIGGIDFKKIEKAYKYREYADSLRQQDEPQYGGVVGTVMADFAGFEFCDSLSVSIDAEGGRIYLLFIKTKDIVSDEGYIYADGIVLAYKYKNGELTLLDKNERLMKHDDGIEHHSLIITSDSLYCLQMEYGVSARSFAHVYFSFDSNGAYVDSMVFSRKVFDEDGVYLEYSSITKSVLGKKFRLKNLTDDVLSKHKYVFARRRPTAREALETLTTVFWDKIRSGWTLDYGYKEELSHIFSSEMAELLHLEYKCRDKTGKSCRLDWDFLCDCQKYSDTLSAKFAIISTDPVQILLTITDLGQTRKLRYDFVEEDWSLVISDVIVEGKKSLKETLQAP